MQLLKYMIKDSRDDHSGLLRSVTAADQDPIQLPHSGPQNRLAANFSLANWVGSTMIPVVVEPVKKHVSRLPFRYSAELLTPPPARCLCFVIFTASAEKNLWSQSQLDPTATNKEKNI